jgi:N-acetylglucosaminyldiphosphoundecaprenol N-acetyl-beta-D-mannosaminyltransferase
MCIYNFVLFKLWGVVFISTCFILKDVKLKFLNVLGFDVYCGSVNYLVESALKSDLSLVINTINPHSYVEQKSDPDFSKALNESDVLIPDGSGIVFASALLLNQKIKKIAGYDLFFETMSILNDRSGKVFFLGSSDIVLQKIIAKAHKDFPNVKINVLSPPFKSSFEQSEIDIFANAINAHNPDVVFVGLTAPKQEKLICCLKPLCNPKFFSGIGAVFDFYAGTVIRPHSFWLKLHLEWLVRLIGEPKRLWKRNFVSTPLFLLEILLTKLGVKKFD